MIKGTTFAKIALDNEYSLRIIVENIYKTAFSILGDHPLYDYFEKYLGGTLIIMDPGGTIITAERSGVLTDYEIVGYVHPLERERYHKSAVERARTLIDSDKISSFSISAEAGTVKIKEGIVFSFSGFEFLELKSLENSFDYRDVFEIFNLYTLLAFDFFNIGKQYNINPLRSRLLDKLNTEEDPLREELLFVLTQDELLEIGNKIKKRKQFFNFGLLNEIFILKVLLQTGFIDDNFVEEVITISNNKFATNGIF